MIFVIGEDDKGNVIVKKTSSVGKSDQLMFWFERVPLQIREIARTVTKLVEIIGYISWNIPLQDAVEEYTNLLTMPSESFDDFAKSIEDLAAEVRKNKNALREMYAPNRKNKDRIRIQSRQQGGMLKYKRYELRIYSRLLKSQENQIWSKNKW